MIYKSTSTGAPSHPHPRALELGHVHAPPFRQDLDRVIAGRAAASYAWDFQGMCGIEVIGTK